MQSLIIALRAPSVDPNTTADLGLTPLHTIIINKRRDRAELLQALLIHSRLQVDIDSCTADGNTALHFAVMVGLNNIYIALIYSPWT